MKETTQRRAGATAVDIVMPLRDGLPYLREAVDSIVGQTLQEWRLLVVDDQSSDGGPEWVESLADDRICLVRNQGRGIVDALNTGIDNTTARYVARMDADDVSEPERLEKQLTEMSHRGLTMLGTAYRIIGEHGNSILLQEVPIGTRNVLAGLARGNPFAHGSLIFDAAALRRAGGYRNRFPLAEDYDLALRVIEYGIADNLKDPLYRWRLRSGSSSLNQTARQNIESLRARNAAARRSTKIEAAPRLARVRLLIAYSAMTWEKAVPFREGAATARYLAAALGGAGEFDRAVAEYDKWIAERPWSLIARLRRRRVSNRRS